MIQLLFGVLLIPIDSIPRICPDTSAGHIAYIDTKEAFGIVRQTKGYQLTIFHLEYKVPGTGDVITTYRQQVGLLNMHKHPIPKNWIIVGFYKTENRFK